MARALTPRPRSHRRRPAPCFGAKYGRSAMTLHTKLCDMLGVKHPIMLAGMGGVSYAELVAAVSNAGGYGVLGMAGRTPDFIRDEMRKVRKLTDKPIGV